MRQEAEAAITALRDADHPEWTTYQLALEEVSGGAHTALQQAWSLMGRVRDLAIAAKPKGAKR
jgi:hypothetical protein